MPIRTYILVALFSSIAIGATSAQEASIADRRAVLTQAVKKDCLADRKGSKSAEICACEARERIRRLSDSEIMRLMRGTDADRANMMSKLRKDGGKSIQNCLAPWGYGVCMKANADAPRIQAKIYCGCLSERYLKADTNASDKITNADHALCQKRAGW
jgi:hypothetical protein